MKKQLLAMILAVFMLLGCLAGCGDGDDGTDINAADGQGQSSASGLAYQASYYPVKMVEEYPIQYMNTACLSGQNLFFTADIATGEMVEEYEPYFGENYTYEKYETALFRIDLTTQETARLEGYQSYDIPEGMMGSSYIVNMSAGSDGTLWICETYNTYYYDVPEDFDYTTGDASTYYMTGENAVRLAQYDGDGNLLQTVEVNPGENVRVWNAYIDGNGYIYSTDGETIYLFDTQGELLGTLQNENYGDLMQFDSERVALRCWTEEGMPFLRMIDPEALAFGEEIELSGNAYSLLPGNEQYQYLYNYNGVIYGHKKTGGDDEKLFSFMDCDVDSSSINYYTVREDGSVVALEVNWEGESPEYSLIMIEQVDASTLPQKQELTLACMYLSWNLRTEIINFNRSSSEYRIVVNDYSVYNTAEDYTAGLTKLNTEILSGVIPDIFYLNSDMPVAKYSAKGILTDLWELIDSDPELSRDDLMTHFFEALEIDGKLYQVTDTFYIVSALGLTRIVGDRTSWTLDELLEALATLEPGATIFGEWDTKSGILSNCISRSIDSFVDWSNPVSPCSFDSQEFIDLLNFANSFPLEFNWDDYDWDSYESDTVRMRTGRQLLTTAYVSSPQDVQYQKANLGGEAISYVGYPSSHGTGSCFQVYSSLAISAACKNVDAAWSFVRNILTEEYQTSEYMYQFPTNRHSFETMVERFMTPQYETDPETGEQVEITTPWWLDDGTTMEIGAVTQEEYELYMKLYESCNSVYSYDQAIMDLITEEVEPFFNGQKTAEETARLIQDRVSLYVMEQS